RARSRCGTIFALPAPDGQAGMLACPHCGAGVPPTNHQCAHCGNQLLVRACPRCFARVFHGAKHCSECGATTELPAHADPDGNPRRRQCPRCDHALVGQLVGDVLLDQCEACGGTYVDVTALERILKERRQARADALLGALPQATVEASHETRVYVKCPDCGTTMNRRNFARGAGVIIDVCRAHGSWFDAGELPRVIEFAMEGGLERAALADAHQVADQAKREQAKRTEAMMVATAYDSEERAQKLDWLLTALRRVFWW
ncbi:MAG TPA: zf-TFIIB domain-containing protein, partial [Kofleriaceae bacterium]|nr:zf-TFIIB domain-containing protein [Kofleriaceae bacterium]